MKREGGWRGNGEKGRVGGRNKGKGEGGEGRE